MAVYIQKNREETSDRLYFKAISWDLTDSELVIISDTSLFIIIG